MKSFAIILAVAVSISGCVSQTRYVQVPGHPFKTDPACKRNRPLGKYDEKCDCARVGFEGFCPNMVGINAK